MISFVVPVYNEATVVERSLGRLQRYRALGHEVVVVDGGSSDATARLAQPLCDRILLSPPGRAKQMNLGFENSLGGLIVFLHIDSALSDVAFAQLLEIDDSSDIVWGRFDVKLDAAAFIFRFIERAMNLRSRLSRIATGDQAIFVSRSLFEALGGYPAIELMEDIALSKLLAGQQLPVCLSGPVISSARRWQRDGVIATIIKMWILRLAYFFGVSPRRLREIYYRDERL